MSTRNLDWQAQAECIDLPDFVFFPPSGGVGGSAKRICHDCPVRWECLEYAMDVEAGESYKHRHGIYGGLGPNERAQLDGGSAVRLR